MHRSRIADASRPIPARRALAQSYPRMRFKLRLQNKAFLHFLAGAKVAVPIGTRALLRSREGTTPDVWASDSRTGFGASRVDPGRKTGAAVDFAMHAQENGTFQK